MKILVCISKTPDTTAKIAFTDNNTKFAADGVQWIINPYDEWYALVRAIEIKEADPSAVLHLINVGEADNDPIIRKALALGGDEAIRINSVNTDTYYIATQIAEIAKSGMIAELLNVPFISNVTKFDLQNASAIVTREIEGGEEKDTVALPAIFSAQQGMAEQRIPNMKGIMGARTKPLKVMEPIAADSLTNIVSFELPPAKQGVKLVSPDTPEELVKLLHEEARVI